MGSLDRRGFRRVRTTQDQRRHGRAALTAFDRGHRDRVHCRCARRRGRVAGHCARDRRRDWTSIAATSPRRCAASATTGLGLARPAWGSRALALGVPPTDGCAPTQTTRRHRDALLRTLGLRATPPMTLSARDAQRAHDVRHRGQCVRRRWYRRGVRAVDEGRAHPPGSSRATRPLVSVRSEPNATPRSLPTTTHRCPACAVLDFTRVIAGPLCTRYLGVLGAEVMRVDPPHRPDMAAGEAADTLLGKRSAVVDVSTPAGGRALHQLLEHADVVVCGYRPGALDRFDLGDDASIERYPGLVVVKLSAWGHPVRGRRGVDSTASCKRPQGSRSANRPTARHQGPSRVSSSITGPATWQRRRCSMASAARR